MAHSIPRHWAYTTTSSAGATREMARIALAAFVVFCVPAVLFYRLILFHFYVRGGFLLDTGLLGSIMWHSPMGLPMPPSLGGRSFFSDRVAPILLLVSAVSDVVPVSMPQLFAGFTGFCHGLLALPILWLLISGYGMRRGWDLVLATLASGAFAFNGLALAIVRFPHFETFGVACLLLFFVALVLERRVIAIVSFLLALATREDIGLHTFGFLAIWIGLNWLTGLPWGRLSAFALAALVYSGVAILVQHWAFPSTSSFVRVYLGSPPFAHLNAELLTWRLESWVVLHSAILLPAIATAIWAVRTRDPYLLAGYAACIPWAVLHLLAAGRFAGLMAGYYAYPFLIAIAWPLLMGLLPGRKSAPTAGSRLPAIGVLGLVLATLAPIGRDWDPGQIPLPGAFFNPPSAEQQQLTDQAILAVAAGRPALGRLLVDSGVAGLAPFEFSAAEVGGWSNAPANTVVYFVDGYYMAQFGAVPNLPWHYSVPGTSLRIATDRPEQTLRDLGIPH